MMNKSYLILPLLLLLNISLTALEVKDNSSRIVFDEKDAVWGLFYNQDGSLKTLYEDRDRRSSYTSNLLDNRSYR